MRSVAVHFSTLALVVLLIAPVVGAKTLADFEAPYAGSPELDGVAEFSVTEEESGKDWGIFYRNHPKRGFSVSIVAENGTTMFSKVGARNLAPLPVLEPGAYRFVIGRAAGEFQVLEQNFSNLQQRGDVEGVMQGSADAFIASFPEWRSVNISGDVTVEVFDLTSEGARSQAAGVPFLLEAKDFTVITLMGDPGARYGLVTEVVDAPPDPNKTPGLGLVLVLAGLVGAAITRRSRG